jgi:hypothetical protein
MESLSEFGKFGQYKYTVILFATNSTKFGISTVGLNGTLVEAKSMHLVHFNVCILDSII